LSFVSLVYLIIAMIMYDVYREQV